MYVHNTISYTTPVHDVLYSPRAVAVESPVARARLEIKKSRGEMMKNIKNVYCCRLAARSTSTTIYRYGTYVVEYVIVLWHRTPRASSRLLGLEKSGGGGVGVRASDRVRVWPPTATRGVDWLTSSVLCKHTRDGAIYILYYNMFLNKTK